MIWTVIKESFNQWSEDKASRLAASLSFYTMLSLAPLLVIAVSVAGFVFGTEQAQTQLLDQIRGLVGEQGAQVIETMLENAARPSVASLAGILGLATLIWGSTNVFAQLQEAMNTIWDVEEKPGAGITATLKDRLLSFSLVVGVGFLLLVSLVVSAAVSAAGQWISDLLPAGSLVWQGLEFLLSIVVITVLFAIMYKVLPDVQLAWRDVWLGAFVTAVLFSIGKYLIGLYLGRQSFGSTYGAAGSLVVLLIWIYYSAQVFFFGAEFTQVYANRFGHGMRPEENARYISPSQRKAANPHAPGRKQRRQPQPALRTRKEALKYQTAANGTVNGGGRRPHRTSGWQAAVAAGLLLVTRGRKKQR